MMKSKLIVLILIVTAVLCGCSVQTPQNYYASSSQKDGIEVNISINCSTILNNMDMLESGLESYVPKDGVILAETKVTLDEKATAYNALSEACRQNQIQFEYEGTNADIYIEGIANLYEFSCGQLSGWEYSVNDVFPSVGCNAYDLKDGDTIKFVYTCDLGADIGNEFTGEE